MLKDIAFTQRPKRRLFDGFLANGEPLTWIHKKWIFFIVNKGHLDAVLYLKFVVLACFILPPRQLSFPQLHNSTQTTSSQQNLEAVYETYKDLTSLTFERI